MKFEQLRIKRNTLAAEARIIKTGEQRALRKARARLGSNKPSEPSYALYNELRDHRLKVVRPAARVAHLAHAYMAGRAYATVEDPKTLRTPLKQDDFDAIASTLRKFGDSTLESVRPKDIIWWTEGGMTIPQEMEKAALESVA